MKILVTGGGGFLGSNIVRQLQAKKFQVRSFTRNHYKFLKDWGVEQIHGDVIDAGAVLHAVQGCDAVIHVAGKAGYWGTYDVFFQPNVVGTQNVINACRKAGVKKLVFTSSPSVVIDGNELNGVNESQPYPKKYKSHYASSKSLSEQQVLAANNHTLSTVSLRITLAWGPGDPHVLPRIVSRARSGTLYQIGSYNPRLDVTFVENAAYAHLLALEKCEPGSPIAGRAYFISQGEPIYIWDFINQLLATQNLPPVSKSIPLGLARPSTTVLETLYRMLKLHGEPVMTHFLLDGLIRTQWFNIEAARRDLGYFPRVSTQEGISKLR